MEKSIDFMNLILVVIIASLVCFMVVSMDNQYQNDYAPVPQSAPLDDFLH